jgi:hypothetical protein
MATYEMETSTVARQKKFKSQPSARKLMLTFLGLSRSSTGTVTRKGHSSKQCSLQ